MAKCLHNILLNQRLASNIVMINGYQIVNMIIRGNIKQVVNSQIDHRHYKQHDTELVLAVFVGPMNQDQNRTGKLIRSLRPSDGIWRQRPWSTLALVMASCLKAPSHNLNQCWLENFGIHPEQFHVIVIRLTSKKSHLKIIFPRIFGHLPGANELKTDNHQTDVKSTNHSVYVHTTIVNIIDNALAIYEHHIPGWKNDLWCIFHLCKYVKFHLTKQKKNAIRHGILVATNPGPYLYQSNV